MVVERHVPGFAVISEQMTARPPQMALLKRTLCHARGMIRTFRCMLQPRVLSDYVDTPVQIAGAPLALIALALDESKLTTIGVVESCASATSPSLQWASVRESRPRHPACLLSHVSTLHALTVPRAPGGLTPRL